ncbi:MAG TPA: nucleotidyltransferase domain-containing protein [Ktedonobacteraceae bacterium]|nr:nucleotidyltransferase domain-containing protein [Ktedonobacteraceae bacterium]
MDIDAFLLDMVDSLVQVEGLVAIVLGGSRASGTQRADSDIDLGLYYRESKPIGIGQLRQLVNKLNDFPEPDVTELGGWGPWVNGGAWLTIKGQRVDFLYRNIDFVSTVIDECNSGVTKFDYLQQPPYGFYSYIYCAETQQCKILYDPQLALAGLKSKVSRYSASLKSSIINGCLWQAEFSLEVAKKTANTGNVFFIAGCLTRIANNLVQVLYALNETYFISDKRLQKDIEQFSLKPQDFVGRLDKVLGDIGRDNKKLSETLVNTQILLTEVIELSKDQYTPKFDLHALSPKSL